MAKEAYEILGNGETISVDAENEAKLGRKIYSQKKYAKKLNIPWGISEAAFSLQDLNYNYQYKAFGIPWLGLKRGLKDEFVVSPYASILALSKTPKDVLKNMEELKKLRSL